MILAKHKIRLSVLREQSFRVIRLNVNIFDTHQTTALDPYRRR